MAEVFEKSLTNLDIRKKCDKLYNLVFHLTQNDKHLY